MGLKQPEIRTIIMLKQNLKKINKYFYYLIGIKQYVPGLPTKVCFAAHTCHNNTLQTVRKSLQIRYPKTFLLRVVAVRNNLKIIL